MDLLPNVLFVAALIYFFSSIQKRKKGRETPPEEPPLPLEPPDIPRERTRTSSRPAGEAQTTEAGGYDYEAFRKKLRKAWKLPEENGEETSDAVQAEKNEPAPVAPPSAKRQQPEAESVPSPEMSAEEARRQHLWQDYARRTEEPEKETTAAPAAALRPVCAKETRRWSERDAEQWVLYDAVFGEPRSRRPWQPLSGRRAR